MSEEKLPGTLLGQRTLAAIVFTDAVNFSGMAQANEEHALRLLQRDTAGIRAIAAGHEGQVLKSTGDGLLIFFNSAVQAVSCSLQIQRWLASEAARLAPGDVLLHRIGIHLGDVFVSESDVMGDGVNIAARLQSEAEPGGICISQTVYDVVKNQLGIKTTCLGPRELKNIRQSVPVYRILMDAHAAHTSAGGKKVLPIAIAALVGVFAAAGLIRIVHMKRNSRNARPQPAPPVAQPSASKLSGGEQLSAADSERADLLRRYDFPRLAQRTRESAGGGAVPLGMDTPQHYEGLANLFSWATNAMSARTEANPLVVSSLPLGGEPFEVWSAAEGRLAMRRNGQVSHFTPSEVKPAIMGLIVLNLVEQSTEPPARKLQLFGEFLKFAREYRLDPNLVEKRVMPKMEHRFQRPPVRGPGMRPASGTRPSTPPAAQ